MTHLRDRHASGLLAKIMTYSPSIALLGMRQVGKTTLLKKWASTYETFDDADFAAKFDRNRDAIMTSSEFPLALDEIQKHPPAFDALKLFIDRKKIPGRYLVSGSVRFASRAGIRESLTGRIALLEIFPLTAAECHSKPLNPFVDLLLKNVPPEKFLAALAKRAWATNATMNDFMNLGGMPGICFKRDPAARQDAWDSHVDTLLGRDIHLIRNFSLGAAKLRSLLVEVAKRQGEPENISLYARLAGTSVPTAKAVLDAFEGLFLIRRYGNEIYLEDPGLSRHLYEDPTPSASWGVRCLYYQLRAQVAIHGRNLVTMEPYRTRGGLYAPFLIRKKTKPLAAVFFDLGEMPSDKSLVGLTTLKKRHPGLKGLILTQRKDGYLRDDKTLVLPWGWVA